MTLCYEAVVGHRRAKLVPVGVDFNTAHDDVSLGDRISIGRAPGNEVVLDDRALSKLHAEIVADHEGFVLRDLGSYNGTFVNGERVSKRRLTVGDVVEMGSACYRFVPVVTGEDGEGGDAAVAIVPKSDVERTQVIAASEMVAPLPGGDIKDIAELRNRYERVRAGFEAVQALLATTDLVALCEKILAVTFELVRAETGALLLFDEAHQLVPWAHRAPPGSGQQVVVSRTIIEEVMQRRAALLASDALTDLRFSSSDSVVLSGLRSLMCVPLINGEHIFGVLHVGNPKQVGAFTATDLELINGIGAGAGLALSNAFLTHRLRAEARARESLGRFLSPVLVEQVVQDSVDLKRGGSEAEVTVMFADIRGFTSLTERSQATAVVSLLNEYFDQMVEVVFRHGGILDKFIGDALMAVWGAPLSSVDDAARALESAREMQATLASYNDLRQDRSEEPVHIGIGLASGRCVSGAIGARRRMEYTVIGDAVNLASRLAGHAAAGQVLCDEETFRRAGSPLGARPLPPLQVKGKTRPVSVLELC